MENFGVLNYKYMSNLDLDKKLKKNHKKVALSDLEIGKIIKELGATDSPQRAKEIRRFVRISKDEESE